VHQPLSAKFLLMGHGATVSPRVEQHNFAPQIDKAYSDRSEKIEQEARTMAGQETSSGPILSNVSAKPALAPLDTQAGKDGAAKEERHVQFPASPKPAGGLAARRKLAAAGGGLGLAISTKKGGGFMDKGEKDPDKKDIQVVERFADHYTLCGEVMPSTNTGMEVLFAKRVTDGHETVVKTRVKSMSFTGKTEEQEWRRSTEMLLNLPESDNIAQVYAVMEDKTTYYIVMEKVDGMDLFELLQSEGRMPIGQAKAILRELLKAINDLHSRGCIHKDLKLENVMVDPKSPTGPEAKGRQSFHLGRGSSVDLEEPKSPTVKLIDFDTVETYQPKTKAKSVVGTDQYIAPEAYAGHYSFSSDIFSIGVIAYRLISGRFPFKNAMFDDKPGENWVGSPKMKQIQDRLKHFDVDFTHTPWPEQTKARELVRWMLQSNEKDRPTAQQTLAHAFLETDGKTPALPKNFWGHNK